MLAIIVGIVVVVLAFLFYRLPVGPWFYAFLEGVHIPFSAIAGIWSRGVTPQHIIAANMNAEKAGIDISMKELEECYLQGKDVENMITSMIASKRSQQAFSAVPQFG